MLNAAKHLDLSVLQGRPGEILHCVQDDKVEALSVSFEGRVISLTPLEK